MLPRLSVASVLGLFAGLVTLASLTGCGSTLAHASAEPTGCAAEQLEIANPHQPMEGPSSWTAICRPPDAEPQEWFCSRAGEAHRVICSEVPRGAATPSALPSAD